MNGYALIAGLLGLIAIAQAKLNAVVLGRPVSVPVLGLIAVIITLVLAALVMVGIYGKEIKDAQTRKEFLRRLLLLCPSKKKKKNFC